MPERIMLFIHSMDGGGSERQMSYLANELVGHSTVCLVTLSPVGLDAYPIDSGVERIGLEMTARNVGGIIRGVHANWKRIQAIRRHVLAWKPNLLISFCDTNNILALLAVAKDIPVIISERSDPRRQKLSGLWETMRRIAYPRSAACAVQTQEVGDYVVESKLVPRDRIAIIPSAVKIPPIDIASIERNRAESAPKKLIFVGRLSREKNVDSLLSAWSKLPHHHDDWRLVIVGDGAERTGLQELARKFGIEASIRWEHWCSDVWGKLSSAHAFCLVSRYEGFPQSVLEAMACGLAVAVTDCSPAIRETISDEHNGLIISAHGNPSEIASTLDRLLSDEKLRSKLGLNARHRAMDFEWACVAPKWLELCQKVVGS
ncbi:MAG: glycosyltransferase [Pirellula sp.]